MLQATGDRRPAIDLGGQSVGKWAEAQLELLAGPLLPLLHFRPPSLVIAGQRPLLSCSRPNDWHDNDLE